MPGAHASANNSHACTDLLGTSCVKAFTAAIRCLISTRKHFYTGGVVSMTGRDLFATKVRFNFKVNSDLKRLVFAAQVKKKKSYARCFVDLT